jgi:hypothetical protein
VLLHQWQGTLKHFPDRSDVNRHVPFDPIHEIHSNVSYSFSGLNRPLLQNNGKWLRWVEADFQSPPFKKAANSAVYLPPLAKKLKSC